MYCLFIKYPILNYQYYSATMPLVYSSSHPPPCAPCVALLVAFAARLDELHLNTHSFISQARENLFCVYMYMYTCICIFSTVTVMTTGIATTALIIIVTATTTATVEWSWNNVYVYRNGEWEWRFRM